MDKINFMFAVRIKTLVIALLALFVFGCSSNPDEAPSESESNETAYQESHPNDPFEGFNRAMWDVNYGYLDPYILRPASLAYVNHTPSFIRKGISNFFSNLDEPSSAVNALLMGNGGEALTHFNRFWINTIFGLLGLFDVASEGGIVKEEERSFSDAIGSYGIGHGPYFMLPGYGPTTTRQVTDVVDGLYAPLSYLNFWGYLGKWTFEGLESRASLVSQEPLLEASPDPYSFARDVYLQRRDYKAGIEFDEAFSDEDEELLDEFLDEEFE